MSKLILVKVTFLGRVSYVMTHTDNDGKVNVNNVANMVNIPPRAKFLINGWKVEN